MRRGRYGGGTVGVGTVGDSAGTAADRLIGRDREIGQLLARLASGQPGLVVIEGDASIGKGRVLRELSARVRAAGHVVVPVEPADPAEPWLSVSKKTTVPDFSAAVDGFKEAAAERAAGESDFSSKAGRGDATGRPLTLVLIHGYDPGAVFHEWFTGDFVRSTADSERLLVVAAGTPVDTGPLKQIGAITLLELGPLPRADVLKWLRAVDAEISDKLTAAEYEAYADAIAVQPERIAAFRRLLPLTSGGAR